MLSRVVLRSRVARSAISPLILGNVSTSSGLMSMRTKAMCGIDADTMVKPAMKPVGAVEKRAMSTAAASVPAVNLPDLRTKFANDIAKTSEYTQANLFMKWLDTASVDPAAQADARTRITAAGITNEELQSVLTAALTTFLVHVESRAAAIMGQGFYTIGPCGEELMAAAALAIQPKDAVALHYRHVATQIMRQLRASKPLSDILLDRARGHTVSALDPVSNGAHCAIGGGPYDFLVTSTLASQACPAVGRAISVGMSQFLRGKAPAFQPLFPKDSVSFVSVGDGSVNNAHFLSAINLAEYAQHRNIRCPTVFIVTDNELCISLRGNGYIANKWLSKLKMPVFTANGNDALSIYTAHKQAAAHARKTYTPAFVHVGGIKRRFGHAATDRQIAYMTPTEIAELAGSNPLEPFCKLLADAGVASYAEMKQQYLQLWDSVRNAFNAAATEPKITKRAQSINVTAVPQTPIPSVAASKTLDTVEELSASPMHSFLTAAGQGGAALADRSAWNNIQTTVAQTLGTPIIAASAPPATGKDVMRKHMTKIYDELLTAYPNMVYIGEDVIHGGYYLVTDGLAAKYPQRVHDFAPDETALIGAGMGFAQSGMLPVVEIPYAKYLDCGADMFFEAAIMCWLSAGKQPNGMIIRLQGFGKGVFGGNFHTHNSLYIPPGVDVVCYSNGADYARGMRYAALQASRGRIVMSVDSTVLLNHSNVFDNDQLWRTAFTNVDEFMDFDQVRVYAPKAAPASKQGDGRRTLAIVTYGEGVLTTIAARKMVAEKHGVEDVTIIDCPLLSAVPAGLKKEIQNFDAVLFADPCKEGQHPLAGHITKLQKEGLLPSSWRSVAAQFTYNPLGNTTTFLSANDVAWEALHLLNPAEAKARAEEEAISRQ